MDRYDLLALVMVVFTTIISIVCYWLTSITLTAIPFSLGFIAYGIIGIVRRKIYYSIKYAVDFEAIIVGIIFIAAGIMVAFYIFVS